MGRVADTLSWSTLKTTVRAYCLIDGTDHDTVLEALFDGAVAKADAYLNNPFEELRPTIVCASVAAGDTVTIGIGALPELDSSEIPERYLTASSSGSLGSHCSDLATFEAATALDEDKREFDIGDADTDTATNLANLINSTTFGGSYGAVGVDGVTASVSSATITLSRRYPGHGEIYVSSSNKTRLMVRQVRTQIDIPNPVYQWVYQYIYRHYLNRAAIVSESTDGVGSKVFQALRAESEGGMVDSYDLLRPYRLAPGG